MFGTRDLWLFILSGLLLNITPGPDTLYIIGRSSGQGVRAGAVAALGIGAGALVHIFAASLGLSALLAASATAFGIVKFIGALYLVYVGCSLLRAATTSAARPSATRPSAARPAVVPLRTVFLQGFLTNILNPKVALFFLSFLPQFVAADAASKPLALLFLGLIFDVNGTLWNLAVAWSSARLSLRLSRGAAWSRRAAFKTWFDRAVGGLFVVVGVRLMLYRDH